MGILNMRLRHGYSHHCASAVIALVSGLSLTGSDRSERRSDTWQRADVLSVLAF